MQLSPGPSAFEAETVLNVGFTLLRTSLTPRIADRAAVQPGVIGFFFLRNGHWSGVDLRSSRRLRSTSFVVLDLYSPVSHAVDSSCCCL